MNPRELQRKSPQELLPLIASLETQIRDLDRTVYLLHRQADEHQAFRQQMAITMIAILEHVGQGTVVLPKGVIKALPEGARIQTGATEDGQGVRVWWEIKKEAPPEKPEGLVVGPDTKQ